MANESLEKRTNDWKKYVPAAFIGVAAGILGTIVAKEYGTQAKEKLKDYLNKPVSSGNQGTQYTGNPGPQTSQNPGQYKP